MRKIEIVRKLHGQDLRWTPPSIVFYAFQIRPKAQRWRRTRRQRSRTSWEAMRRCGPPTKLASSRSTSSPRTATRRSFCASSPVTRVTRPSTKSAASRWSWPRRATRVSRTTTCCSCPFRKSRWATPMPAPMSTAEKGNLVNVSFAYLYFALKVK